ncbi:MAG: hypothetical protein WD874_02170 [Parcubacteria group bacterium]
MLAEANRVIGEKIPGTSFRNSVELANYLESTTEVLCPVGENARLSRVLGKRVLPHDIWERPFRDGEKCLYDNNAGVFILSLSCANFIKSSHSVASAMQPAPVAVTTPQPFRVFTPTLVYDACPNFEGIQTEVPQATHLENGQCVNIPRRGWSTERKVVTGLIATAVVAGVVCAAVCRSKSTSRSNSNSSSNFLGGLSFSF